MKRFYRILSLAAVAVMLAGVVKTEAAGVPAGKFDGYYVFSSTLKVENPTYSQSLKDTYEFKIATTLYNTEISNLIIPTIYATYDEGVGELTLTTNYGQIGGKSLGFADANANWTGMGSMKGTLLKWRIGSDGSISVPDFTIVDYSGSDVKVVARYSNCKVAVNENIDPNNPEPGEEKENFAGAYTFKARQTAYTWVEDGTGGKVLDDTTVTQDYLLRFTINEDNQIWDFDGYSLIPGDNWSAIRNLGEVVDNRYIMDADIYNGVEWIYIVEEDNESTEAKLFGGRSTENWVQGQRAFTLTKNSDGTFSLTDFTLFKRTMEMVEGFGEVMNKMRVYRPIRLWENFEFVSYDPDAEVGNSREGNSNIKPQFEIDEVSAKADANTAMLTVNFRALRARNLALEEVAKYEVRVSGIGQDVVKEAEWDAETISTIGTVVRGSVSYSISGVEKGEYDLEVMVTAYDKNGAKIADADFAQTATVMVPEFRKSGLGVFTVDDGNTRYYNLQGVEVKNPRPGEIVIRCRGARDTVHSSLTTNN